jgi:serine-type D-Ala-D-Ala carboxypeptidase (penicillin-binding protein 5/6)
MPNPIPRADGISRLTELMRYDAATDVAAPPALDPSVRRKRRRRRGIVGGIVFLVISGLIGTYVGLTLSAPLGPATLEAAAPSITVPAAAELALSPDAATAISVTGAEDYLGPAASGIWAAGGGDDARPLASISKLITALVVLEAKPLAAGEAGPTITFDRDDHALYDKYYVLNATIAAMPTGSSMSEHDALEAMLVISASNYADAVSSWAYGSRSAFLNATREWLAANGLAHTTMVEPTGIDARNTSTPSDLIALGRIAMANPVIAEIVAMETLNVPNIPAARNTNDLLGVDGITGIKTGTLDPTGSNLLFSATLDVGVEQPLSVIAVLMGGYTHESVALDARALLASIRAGFHEVPVGERGQAIGSYSTAWGESAEIELAESASVLTWSDTAITATFNAGDLATGTEGDEVGEVTWVAGPRTVTVPLVLAGDIDPPTAWWRLTHPFEVLG